MIAKLVSLDDSDKTGTRAATAAAITTITIPAIATSAKVGLRMAKSLERTVQLEATADRNPLPSKGTIGPH
ncbi:hypothetical protein GCM10009734_85730 [Nonomuraea bangladeshensis]